MQDQSSRYYGCLDDSELVPHSKRMPVEDLKELIREAIDNANMKSGRAILSIPDDATADEIEAKYARAGKELFDYFREYPSDPASTADQLYGQHYRDVGIEQFRNRTLQKERMNSDLRYEYMAERLSRDLDSLFADYSCEEIMTAVLDALIATTPPQPFPAQTAIPEQVLNNFGEECRQAGIIGEDGIFHDPYALVHFFCNAQGASA